MGSESCRSAGRCDRRNPTQAFSFPLGQRRRIGPHGKKRETCTSVGLAHALQKETLIVGKVEQMISSQENETYLIVSEADRGDDAVEKAVRSTIRENGSARARGAGYLIECKCACPPASRRDDRVLD